MKNIIIVGGGIAGLSFAYECLKKGKKVILVEADAEVGGLSKSIFYNDCFLDIGVHIYYLKDKEVYTKIREIVDDKKQWIKIKRNGKLYLKGKYIDWPLKYTTLFQFPFLTGCRIFLDQLFRNTTLNSSKNFHDELLSLYGPTLYYSFFQPITQKFLQIDPKRVHSDWAFSSIRAATKIEDKSFSESYKYQASSNDKQAFNIFRFILQSVFADRNDEPFYYFRDGFGVLVNKYRDKIIRLGGIIKTNSRVKELIIKNMSVTNCVINDKTYDTEKIIWTGDPFSLCRLLNVPKPKLNFLNSKYIYFFLKNCYLNHQVCYYADPEISFVRGTILSKHSGTIIRNKNISEVVCLEYSFINRSDMINSSSVIKKSAIRDLIKIGMIKDKSDIQSYYEINVPTSYPILTVDYPEQYLNFSHQINRFRNIITFGRQGGFNYNNIDIILKEVLMHPYILQLEKK